MRRLRGDQRLAAAQVYLDIVEAVGQASQASKAGVLTIKRIHKIVFWGFIFFTSKKLFWNRIPFRTDNRVLQLLLAF